MNEIAIEELGPEFKRVAAELKHGSTVLTSNGSPMALVLSLDIYDQEDVEYMTSPAFWKMIEERRKESTIPWDQVKAEMFAIGSGEIDSVEKK